MWIKRFSIVFGVVAGAAGAVSAAPARFGDVPEGGDGFAIVLAQSVKERPLEDIPPVDAGRAAPPSSRASPPPPPPRVTTRGTPPAAEDESRPPAREVPPPPMSTSRVAPPPASPPRDQEPAPIQRTAPRGDGPPSPATSARRTAPPSYDDPPPPRRADTARRAPSTRSAFYANCTQQCHLSCEASFEACNGDSSPAKPACVKKLESCRVERCSCRLQ